jgi:hypothetical protein
VTAFPIAFTIVYMDTNRRDVRSAVIHALDIDSAARRGIEDAEAWEFVAAVVQADLPLAVARTVT